MTDLVASNDTNVFLHPSGVRKSKTRITRAETHASAAPCSLCRCYGRSQPLLFPASRCFRHWHSLAGGHIISISTSTFSQPSPLCVYVPTMHTCLQVSPPLHPASGMRSSVIPGRPVQTIQHDLLISKSLNYSHQQRLSLSAQIRNTGSRD